MPEPVCRSAVTTTPAVGHGVRLEDSSERRKLLLHGHQPSVPFGLTARATGGGLALGYGYDEVLLLDATPSPPTEAVDLTHGLTLLRLTGPNAPDLLARVCALDLSDAMTPDATLRRCPVAGLGVTLVRDDTDGERSYLLLVDRSYGQSLAEVLLDAGAEFGLRPAPATG